MKKILVILLSMAMVLTMFACDFSYPPKGQGGEDVDNRTIVYEDGETTIYLTEDGKYVDQDGKEIEFEEEEDPEIEDEFDFGFDIAKTYGFDKVMQKVDYSNLEGQQENLLTNTAKLAKQIFGSDFALDTAYNEAGDDAIVGTYGYENEDVNQKNLEIGIYKSSEQNAYIHYITYSCECLTDSSDETINKATTDLKNAFGITVNKDKLKESVNKLLSASEEQLEEMYDYQVVDKDYDLFTEMASISTVGYVDGGQRFWYICVDIEREYK